MSGIGDVLLEELWVHDISIRNSVNLNLHLVLKSRMFVHHLLLTLVVVATALVGVVSNLRVRGLHTHTCNSGSLGIAGHVYITT